MVRFRRRVYKRRREENQENVLIGVIVGVIIVLILLLGICFWQIRKRRRRNKERANQGFKPVPKDKENGGAEHLYAAADTNDKKHANTAKKTVKCKTDSKGGNYAQVEFSPDPKASKPIPRYQREVDNNQGESAKYTQVRVRPISDPRYANCI